MSAKQDLEAHLSKLEQENDALKQHIKKLIQVGDNLEEDKRLLKAALLFRGLDTTTGFGSTVKWKKIRKVKL